MHVIITREELKGGRLGQIQVGSEHDVQDGDWIGAAEKIYNAQEEVPVDRPRYLIVAERTAPLGDVPYGIHRVRMATYDDAEKKYRYDREIFVTVLP